MINFQQDEEIFVKLIENDFNQLVHQKKKLIEGYVDQITLTNVRYLKPKIKTEKKPKVRYGYKLKHEYSLQLFDKKLFFYYFVEEKNLIDNVYYFTKEIKKRNILRYYQKKKRKYKRSPIRWYINYKFKTRSLLNKFLLEKQFKFSGSRNKFKPIFMDYRKDKFFQFLINMISINVWYNGTKLAGPLKKMWPNFKGQVVRRYKTKYFLVKTSFSLMLYPFKQYRKLSRLRVLYYSFSLIYKRFFNDLKKSMRLCFNNWIMNNKWAFFGFLKKKQLKFKLQNFLNFRVFFKYFIRKHYCFKLIIKLLLISLSIQRKLKVNKFFIRYLVRPLLKYYKKLFEFEYSRKLNNKLNNDFFLSVTNYFHYKINFLNLLRKIRFFNLFLRVFFNYMYFLLSFTYYYKNLKLSKKITGQFSPFDPYRKARLKKIKYKKLKGRSLRKGKFDCCDKTKYLIYFLDYINTRKYKQKSFLKKIKFLKKLKLNQYLFSKNSLKKSRYLKDDLKFKILNKLTLSLKTISLYSRLSLYSLKLILEKKKFLYSLLKNQVQLQIFSYLNNKKNLLRLLKMNLSGNSLNIEKSYYYLKMKVRDLYLFYFYFLRKYGRKQNKVNYLVELGWRKKARYFFKRRFKFFFRKYRPIV